MKKLIIICIAIGLSAFIIAIQGCTKPAAQNSISNTPFHGPHNPSFETPGLDSVFSWNSQSYIYYNAWAYWQAPSYEFSYNMLVPMTGTGFLPSQGNEYISMTNYENNGAASNDAGQVYFYQDSVDLSRSTTMTFDYTLASASPIGTPACVGGCPKDTIYTTITAQILFTSNGTITLWQQSITGTSILVAGSWSTTTTPAAPIQTLGQTITLPSLPSSGRLLFQIVASTTGLSGTANLQYPVGTFCVDNIRVR